MDKGEDPSLSQVVNQDWTKQGTKRWTKMKNQAWAKVMNQGEEDIKMTEL